MFEQLTLLFNNSPRYSYPEYMHNLGVRNGIYVQFETDETFHHMDRVVRIGSHPSQNNLLPRLNKHYYNNDHRTSVFRNHVGRAILNRDENDYWQYWAMDIQNIPEGFFNPVLEATVEQQVTDFIRHNTSFCIIPDLDDQQQRKRLEARLIATIANPENISSANWLGRHHPQYLLAEHGLWNVHHVNGMPLTEEEFEFIQHQLGQ